MPVTTTLTIGTAGVNVPALSKENQSVLVTVHIPALNAGTHTAAVSLDGTNWYSITADIDGNVWPTTTSTAQRAVFGPLCAGSKFRITSSVAQTATPVVAFMAS